MRLLLGFAPRRPAAGFTSFLWSSLYFAIRHLLLEKASGLTFIHDHIREAVEQRYLSKREQRVAAHRCIARSMVQHPYRQPSGGVNTDLLDLPYHQFHGELMEECVSTLCNIEFLDCKIEAGQVYSLVEDYRRTCAAIDPTHPFSAPLNDFWRSISNQLPLIRRQPDAFLGAMANQPDNTNPSRNAKALLEEDERPWLRWTNKDQCPSTTKMHLEGHRDPVYACACSPTSNMLASGGRSMHQ